MLHWNAPVEPPPLEAMPRVPIDSVIDTLLIRSVHFKLTAELFRIERNVQRASECDYAAEAIENLIKDFERMRQRIAA